MRRTIARWSFGAAWLLLCACARTVPSDRDSKVRRTHEHSPSTAGGGSTPVAGETAGSASPPTMPDNVPPTSRCPNVFSGPVLPSTPERTDDGVRGLDALRTELKDSLARWQSLSAAAGGRYSYTRSSQSFTGQYCRTTIHFDGGKATSRSELSGNEMRMTEMFWMESANAFDTRRNACHPVVTLDALYEQCLTDVLCHDPTQHSIYLTFDQAGVLLQCRFVPFGCFDDCSEGVSLQAVHIGDDAPECCLPSATPNCCMAYGGAMVHGACSEVCDGMPLPGAAWHRELDDYGCAKWVEPPPNGECCGCQ